MTLAKSLTAPRGEGYFSAANMVLAISTINSAIARASIILPLLLKELFFTNYRSITIILKFTTRGINLTIYLEKARPRSKALLNTDDHVGFMHYFKYFRLKQDNISYPAGVTIA